MTIYELHGRINEKGELEVTLPQHLPPQPVRVVVELQAAETLPWEERPWTAEELAEMLPAAEPGTGAEIADLIESGEVDLSSWGELPMDNVVEWVKQQRQQRRQARFNA